MDRGPAIWHVRVCVRVRVCVGGREGRGEGEIPGTGFPPRSQQDFLSFIAGEL